MAPFWLVHGSDGSLLIYGKTPASRRASADPDHPLGISAWLLCESMNPRGEHIAYVYKADDQSPDSVIDYGIQRYLERVCYGNSPPAKTYTPGRWKTWPIWIGISSCCATTVSEPLR